MEVTARRTFTARSKPDLALANPTVVSSSTCGSANIRPYVEILIRPLGDHLSLGFLNATMA
jgi:hypothetical protein